jgi:hypothetical protein
MWSLRFALTLVVMLFSTAQAAVSVEVCFNYGCVARAVVRVDDGALTRVGAMFATVSDPAGERDAIARAVAKLYRVAGGQTPIFADRAGNLLDGGAEGRMDCIDHSTTTTVLLHVLADQGWLRFHRVLEPKRRTRFVFQHLSAAIEEVDVLEADQPEQGPESVPDHVPILLALCDCVDVIADMPEKASRRRMRRRVRDCVMRWIAGLSNTGSPR